MNTNAKHTPGPWHFSTGHDPHNQAQIYGDDGKTLAITFADEGSANAALIAAAPELLEALRYAAEAIELLLKVTPKEKAARIWAKKRGNDARAAIAQAEGGAQ